MDDRLIASIRDGIFEVGELLARTRELAADEQGREALYDGARERMLTDIRSEDLPQEELDALKGAFQRISSYAWGAGPEAKIDPLHLLAVRMEVLAQAIADQSAFSASYGAEDLRFQPHVQACLAALFNADGSQSREALLTKLGLKQSNGTRVLKLLERARLISRRKAGQAVTVVLTPLGRKMAMKWSSPSPTEPSPRAPVIALREGPVRGMPNDHWPISMRAYATIGQ